ncbi:ureidoglycolate lyase [Vibrio nigripulchritudo]|uniref:ureidoglycolate lyase n=1 Tax=Vibrio nigripulchritudo TaxID=28173 RepID=UPI0003B2408F|nr:ureidoglycolate lyase [Vibrio nigripulchritudo]CCN69428.1 ureidoglycolate hydrolase [Vibrio nigripulchritudo SFn118]
MSAEPLIVEPLTKDAFSPFGDVIESEGSEFFLINNGSTKRFHHLAQADTSAYGGNTIISIFEATPLSYPLDIEMLERHPLGSQAFMPLFGNPFLIVVAAGSDKPDANTLRAFLSNGKQGVNYHKGVWHHPVLALSSNDQFLVVDRNGEGSNCDEYYFQASEIRSLPLTSGVFHT